MYEESLLKAIQYFGSQKELANALGVSQQAVNNWINRSKKLPYIKALKIALYTEGNISLEDLSDEEKDLTALLKISSFLKTAPVVYLPLEKIVKDNKKCPVYREHDKLPLDTAHVHLTLPILVDSNNHLIVCECRLRSYKSIHSKVKVCRLNAKEILKNGSDISSLLGRFPMSERIEVGLFIERELGNRRGKRTDLELVDNYPQVKTGSKTRKIAAEISGFGSDFTYRQVKKIVSSAIPEVIKAMDEGTLAILKASQIANLAEEEQYVLMARMNKK